MKNSRKRNVIMLVMTLLLGLFMASGKVQAAEKNPSDVAELNAIINSQRAAGATVPTDLDAACYEWNSKGRLIGIYWSVKTMYPTKPNLKGTISFSKLPALKSLYVGDSPKLTGINIKKNKNLTTFICEETGLTKLDVSKNKKISSLFCQFNNKLTRLDVSKNKNLTKLYCNYNKKLTTLKMGSHKKLTKLFCNRNKLTKLDVSGITKLSYLDCSNNKLKELDVSRNKRLEQLYCKKNKIKTLYVPKYHSIEIERDKKVSVIRGKVTSIKFSKTSGTFFVGNRIKLTAKVNGTLDSKKTVVWTSSNKKVVTVSGKGSKATIKAVGPGKATITVKSTDGTKKKATYKITVKKKPTTTQAPTTQAPTTETPTTEVPTTEVPTTEVPTTEIPVF